MARAKPELVPLHALSQGQFADFFALLAERTRGMTRDGKPFYTCRFQDAKRSLAIKVWGDTPWFAVCEKEWQAGSCFKIRAVYSEHDKYGPQLDLHNVRLITAVDREDGFDLRQLLEHSRRDSADMLLELRQLAESTLEDPSLKRLVLALLDRHGPQLGSLPATLNKFYPYVGGWLEHTLGVTKSCLLLVERYRQSFPDLKPPLNRDLVVAGAILHDIGRVVEFDATHIPTEPTIPGRLLGHLFLGRDLVRDCARELGDVNAELLQLLEHLIVTHLNLPEWGSPRLPLIPESLILHHADDLDAKMEMYVRCLTRDASPGPFTDRDPILNRHLFKGRSV